MFVHAQDLLEILGEIYITNFFIVMKDLKLRIKAGTSNTVTTLFLNSVLST